MYESVRRYKVILTTYSDGRSRLDVSISTPDETFKMSDEYDALSGTYPMLVDACHAIMNFDDGKRADEGLELF